MPTVAISYRIADNAKKTEKYNAIEEFEKNKGAVRLGTTSLLLLPTNDSVEDVAVFFYYFVSLDEDDGLACFELSGGGKIYGAGDVNKRYVNLVKE